MFSLIPTKPIHIWAFTAEEKVQVFIFFQHFPLRSVFCHTFCVTLWLFTSPPALPFSSGKREPMWNKLAGLRSVLFDFFGGKYSAIVLSHAAVVLSLLESINHILCCATYLWLKQINVSSTQQENSYLKVKVSRLHTQQQVTKPFFFYCRPPFSLAASCLGGTFEPSTNLLLFHKPAVTQVKGFPYLLDESAEWSWNDGHNCTAPSLWSRWSQPIPIVSSSLYETSAGVPLE